MVKELRIARHALQTMHPEPFAVNPFFHASRATHRELFTFHFPPPRIANPAP
jgi:hypothetical protein